MKEKDNANLNKVDSTIDVVDTSKHDNSNSEMIVSSESNKLLQFTRSSINLSDDNINSNQPYDKAIKLLQSIVDYKVPLEKLIIIASVSAEITVCVNDFWQKMRSIVTPSLLNIDADELILATIQASNGIDTYLKDVLREIINPIEPDFNISMQL